MFKMPFIIKILGPDIIKKQNYINDLLVNLNFHGKIFNLNNFNVNIIKNILNSSNLGPILIILNSIVINLKLISKLYSKARHLNISIISIDTDLDRSELVQIINTDHFVIFKNFALNYTGNLNINIKKINNFFKKKKKYDHIIYSPFDKYEYKLNSEIILNIKKLKLTHINDLTLSTSNLYYFINIISNFFI